MNKKICLVILLSSILFISNANAINISLVNSISVHEFNSSNKDILKSDGQFIVSNQDDEKVFIKLSSSNNIKQGDMGPDGEPRKHIVSPYIYFHPLPDESWIVFEDEYIEIEGKSEYLVTYHVEIPLNELPSYVNETNGFISYIDINPQPQDGSGSVGVNYQHKVFIEFEEGFKLPVPLIYYIFVLIGLISIIFLVVRIRLKERKKTKHL